VFWTVLRVGLRSLLGAKLRSMLAMLGIIIGVGAVIAMLALGSGAQQQVLDRFSALGTNLLIVSPGQRGSHGVVTGVQEDLTLDDALAIAREVPGVAMVAPAVQGSVQAKYGNRNTRTSVLGTTVTYLPVRAAEVERGRAFTEGEADRLARVALIGPKAAEDLFGESDPVGETVKLNGINFRVVGLLKAKGEGWGSPDDRLIVPVSTAMKILFGLDAVREIDVQASSEDRLDEVEAAITRLLRRRHRLRDETPDDFSVRNLAEIRENATEVTGIFKWLLGGIAAISLLVGGIGIMNIMLVTVTERTREIGIRKAVGARERHILTQFLAESVIISGAGGVIGLALGAGAAALIPRFGPLQTRFEWTSALLAIGVAAGVGVFFGFYPAWRAARLDPIQALRHE